MRFRDRPLLPDGIDARLYVDRPALEASVRSPLLSERNVLLLGESGSGKTTLMRRTASQLEEAGRRVVWANASLATDVTDLLATVEYALRGSDGTPDAADDQGGWVKNLLAQTLRLGLHDPSVIFLDGSLDPDVGFDFFGRLRDELWGSGHTWVVAARPSDSTMLRSPPAEAFWSVVLEIPPLDDDQVDTLLRLGLEDDELAGLDEHGRPLFGGHPRAVIREVVTKLEGGPVLDASRLVERAAALGRSESMAMYELIDLGRPTSVHDPELLARLGWSRPYAQRILARLEAAGLVRALLERGDKRPGRPRKLYEPMPARNEHRAGS